MEHYRRHGDPLKASYTAVKANPYKKAAAVWIKRNADDRFVQAAISRIGGLMSGAGQAIAPRNLRGVAAKQKARSIWARLRSREVAAEDILATILGVAMCHTSDPQKGKAEYLRVQIAKVLNRMAGGEVKRWVTHHTDPMLPKKKVLRWFPASEGLVLRELGKTAELTAEFLIHERMEALLTTYDQQRNGNVNRKKHGESLAATHATHK